MRTLFEQLLQDIRYALRGIRRSPGFATAVIVTLGLGIGANAAMFGVVDRLMFRPYAYLKDPATVHRLYMQSFDRGTLQTSAGGQPYARYLDFRNGTTSFSHLAAFTSPNLAVGVGDAARERRVGVVSAQFWDFFSARPALGRFFSPAEDTTPRGADVAVLAHAFWQAEFGGRNVVGERVKVGNMDVTIIGVAPEGFHGVMDTDPPALYVPITTYAASSGGSRDRNEYYSHYNWGWVSIMTRRKPGVTVEQAEADATVAFAKSWEKELADWPQGPPVALAKPTVVVGAMKTGAGPDPSLEARTALWVTGVAVVVLIIACANVANLLLSRAIRRRRETAVRLALGVSRRRLLTQTLTESVVLSVIGCVIGLAVAHWGGRAIRRMLITSQNASLDAFTDWRTIGIAAGAALLSGLLAGLVPGFLSGRGALSSELKAGAREGAYQRSRTRTGLLVFQGALSVMLLVGAGLFVRSLDKVRDMRIGYEPERVLYVSRNMRGLQLDSVARVALRNRLLETAQHMPGVDAAAWVSSVPFWSTSSTRFYVTGIDTVARLGRFTYQTTTPDYFDAMGTRILRGRGITDADREGAPRVAVITESMGRALWPDKDAMGQCMRVGADTNPCTTVVGIAEDMVQNDLTGGTRYHYYLPVEQYNRAGGNGLFLKMSGDPQLQRENVRKTLQALMPGQSYVTVTPLIDIVDGARRSWKLGATMFVAFGVLALLVAAVGVYGVIAYNVAQRMHELGVRVALGAQAGDIMRLVVGQGLRFAVAGAMVGLAVALFLSGWLQPLLFQQSARDPVVYTVVAALLLTTALVASASPAFRAARADPNAALRSD